MMSSRVRLVVWFFGCVALMQTVSAQNLPDECESDIHNLFTGEEFFQFHDLRYVKKHRIRKISFYMAEVNGKKSSRIYSASFDSLFHPSYYEVPQRANVRLTRKMLIALRLSRDPSGVITYSFDYDNGLLVGETIVNKRRFNSNSWDERFYKYAYDSNGWLVERVDSQVTRYKPGFTYRGAAYEDYSSTYQYSYNYNSAGCRVKRVSENYNWQTYQKPKPSDTHFYDTFSCTRSPCPMDSLYSNWLFAHYSDYQIVPDTLNLPFNLWASESDGFFRVPMTDEFTRTKELKAKLRILRKMPELHNKFWVYYENNVLVMMHFKDSDLVYYFDYEI